MSYVWTNAANRTYDFVSIIVLQNTRSDSTGYVTHSKSVSKRGELAGIDKVCLANWRFVAVAGMRGDHQYLSVLRGFR